jgi:AAA ATPase-like protein
MHPMRRSLVSPVLVGRDAELAALTAALDDAVEGVPGVVLLGGEAGVGKTRLVEEAAQGAQAAGARVLTGSCVELGGEGLPFAPLADDRTARAWLTRRLRAPACPSCGGVRPARAGRTRMARRA